MKKVLCALFVMTSCVSFGQKIHSYGIDFGLNIYDIEAKGKLSGGSGISFINIGGFLDVKLTDRFGVKTKLIFSKIKEDGYSINIGGSTVEPFATNIILNNIQLQSLLKFHFNQNYGTDVYLIAGPKLMYVYDIESEFSKIEINELYNRLNLFLLLGFSLPLNTTMNLEFLLDYGITNLLKFGDNRSQNIGGVLSLSIDVDEWF